MGQRYRKFDEDFRHGAVRLLLETGKPIAEVARELGINEGTLGNWVGKERSRLNGSGEPLSQDERAELVALRREHVRRNVVFWTPWGLRQARLRRETTQRSLGVVGDQGEVRAA